MSFLIWNYFKKARKKACTIRLLTAFKLYVDSWTGLYAMGNEIFCVTF